MHSRESHPAKPVSFDDSLFQLHFARLGYANTTCRTLGLSPMIVQKPTTRHGAQEDVSVDCVVGNNLGMC